jgi:vitamin B12 transporter
VETRLSIPSKSRTRRTLRGDVAAPLLAAGVLATALPVCAQPVASLPPVVVTAARMPQALTDLVADVTVIDSPAIRRSGAQSLADLLQRQPGVEILQNGGPGATSGVFLRGANAAQTLVLVDGLRVASSANGATALEAIPLEQIDHIEILRGPSSSLYGADAIGGVIQVFTRGAARGFHANASAGYGTHDTVIATAGANGGNERVRASAQVGERRSPGFNAIVNPANFAYDPDRDGYRETSASAQLVATLAPDHELTLQALRSRLDNAFDAGDGFDDRTVTTLTAWQLASRDRITAAWQSRLWAGEGGDDSVSKTGLGEFPFRTRQIQYGWQNEIEHASLGGRLTLALERREERVDAQPAFPVDRRATSSLTAVYARVDGPHALQANVRHDRSDQFGNRTTGALAYGYRIDAHWRVRASAGTAFKAPTFNDLYFPGFANPGLQPETARNVEAGVQGTWAWRGVSMDAAVTAWHNRVRDLIVFACDASFTCLPQNIADATLKGVSLTLGAMRGGTRVQASADLQSPRDAASGLLLPRRARRHGTVSLLQDAGRGNVGVELVASSRRFDDAANLRPMGGYLLVNLTAEWPVTRDVVLFVRGDNVLDRNYELAADFATGGARAFAGVRWRL